MKVSDAPVATAAAAAATAAAFVFCRLAAAARAAASAGGMGGRLRRAFVLWEGGGGGWGGGGEGVEGRGLNGGGEHRLTQTCISTQTHRNTKTRTRKTQNPWTRKRHTRRSIRKVCTHLRTLLRCDRFGDGSRGGSAARAITGGVVFLSTAIRRGRTAESVSGVTKNNHVHKTAQHGEGAGGGERCGEQNDYVWCRRNTLQGGQC